MNKKTLYVLLFAIFCVVQPLHAKIKEGKWQAEWKSVKKSYKKQFKNRAFSKETKKREELVSTLLKSLDKNFKQKKVKKFASQLEKYKKAGKGFIASIKEDIDDAENDGDKKTLKDVKKFFETALKAITTSATVSLNKLKGMKDAKDVFIHFFDDVSKELYELELLNAKWIAAAKKGASSKKVASLIKKEKKDLLEIRQSIANLSKMENKFALPPDSELATIANTLNGIASGSIASYKKEDVLPTLEQFADAIKSGKKWLKKARKAQLNK